MYKEGDKVIIVNQGGGHLIRHHLVVNTTATVISRPYKDREIYRLYGIDDEADMIHQTVSVASIKSLSLTTNAEALHLLTNDFL